MNDETEKSKSQRKREMLALQELGERLVALTPAQLAKIPLEDELLQLIKFTKTIKGREGLRRQLQYVGKIMREYDPEPIIKALENIHKQPRKGS